MAQNITLDGVIEATEGRFAPGDGDARGDIVETRGLRSGVASSRLPPN